MVERLAIRIGSGRADGQLALRIRVVKRDGLGDGIVGVEAIVVRLAVELGVELDGGVVRRPADAVLDVGHGSVGGIFDIRYPSSSDQPCDRRKGFGSRWRGSGLRLCESACGENGKPEEQRGAGESGCHVRSCSKVLAGGLTILLNVPLAIRPPTEHNSMFAFSSHTEKHGAELPTIRLRTHGTATPRHRACAWPHAGGGGRRHRQNHCPGTTYRLPD